MRRGFERSECVIISFTLRVPSCLLFKLVEKDKNARLCCKDGVAGLSEIKNLPWFEGMDWKLLEGKKVTPPMRPDVSPLILAAFWR